jgi:hypothetical protein
MAKAQDVSNDYTLLSEMSDSVVITAKIVERGDQFTTAKTAAALYSIPNDSIVNVKPVKGNEEELSQIRVKQNAKIVQKTLATASRIAGIQNIIALRPTGGINLCEQCCTQCCEQCCTQCCEQCCTQCSSGILVMLQAGDPALAALAAAGAFRTVVG